MSAPAVVPLLRSCEDCGRPIEPGDLRPLELFRITPDAPAGKRSRAGGRRFRLWILCRRCAGEALRQRSAKNGTVSENGKKRSLRTRERVPPRRGGRPRLLTDEQVRSAHVLYELQELTLKQLAGLLMRAGHAGTEDGLMSALWLGFRRLRLPMRSRAEAIRLGRWRDHEPKQRRPKCRGTNRKKKPCSLPAMRESEFCYAHDPATREVLGSRAAAQLAAWKERDEGKADTCTPTRP